MAAIGAFVLCTLIWGSTWYAIELQLGIVPKEWSVVFRFGLAAVGLQCWCWFRGLKIKPDLYGHLAAAGTGGLLFGLNYVLVYAGTQYLTSGFVAVAFSMLSLMNILSARIFLKIPVQLPIVIAALMGVLGLILVFDGEVREFNLEDQTIYGLALCIAATMIASLGNTVAASKTAKKYRILPFTALALFYSTLVNLTVAIINGAPLVFDFSATYVASLLYLSFFGTVVAFTVYLWLIGAMGMAKAGYIAVVTPIVALVISTIFENFVWHTTSLAGLGFILLGNALITRFRSAPPPPAPLQTRIAQQTPTP